MVDLAAEQGGERSCVGVECAAAQPGLVYDSRGRGGGVFLQATNQSTLFPSDFLKFDHLKKFEDMIRYLEFSAKCAGVRQSSRILRNSGKSI